MSYRIVIERNADEMWASVCPWTFRVYDPEGERISAWSVHSEEYAERLARDAVEADKRRRASRREIEIAP